MIRFAIVAIVSLAATTSLQAETVVILFTQDGCEPCVRQKPAFAAARQAMRNARNIVFEEINISREPGVARKFRITGTPSMLFGYTLTDGKTIRQNSRAVGVIDRGEILRRLTRATQAQLDELPPPDTAHVQEAIRQ